MSKVIYCLAEQAFSHQDEDRSLAGGGERWLTDFISVLKEMRYTVKVFQYSCKKYTKKFCGHIITGLGNIQTLVNPTAYYRDGLNAFLEYAEKDKADGIFFLSLNLCSASPKISTLSVSHGIIFDRCEKDSFINGGQFLEELKKWVRNTTQTISVDTNTLHAMSMYWPDNLKRMSYIPNYFDENVFTPYKKEDDGKFTVLFSRRIDPARGHKQMQVATEELIKRHGDKIKVIFCGKGNKYEEQEMAKWLVGKEENVTWTSSEPDDMYKIYRLADVSVVATLYAEGTSLSCIESLATGVPVISTWQGGLSDLVQNKTNGILIAPNKPEKIVDAVEYFMNNPDELERMRHNAINMSKAFSKTRWKEQIKKVAISVYGEPE